MARRLEARRGSRLSPQLIFGKSRIRALPLVLLLLAPPTILHSAQLPLEASGPALIVELAGCVLAEELPILLPPESAHSDAPEAAAEASLLQNIVPKFRIRRGPPPIRKPDDWTRHWMFGMGLLLFAVSWFLAVWERTPSTYREPLLEGEPVPAPQPPHIIYSLTRTR